MNGTWIICSTTLLCILVGSCSSTSDETAQYDSNDAATAVGPLCADVDVYADGLEKTGPNGLVFRILRSDLNPPDRGLNTFYVELLLEGAKTSDYRLVAEPIMPLHGHGTVPTTFEASADETSQYKLGPMDLFMSGRWEMQIDAFEVDGESADAADAVVFAFCLEG